MAALCNEFTQSQPMQDVFPQCMNIIMMPTLTDMTLKGHTHNEPVDYDIPSGDHYGLSVD